MPKEPATKKKQQETSSESESEEEQLIRADAKKVKGGAAAGKAAPKQDLKVNNKLKNKEKVAKKDSSDEESSEDDAPKNKQTKPAAKNGKAPAAKKAPVDSDSDDSDAPAPKGKAAVAKKPAAKNQKMEVEDSDESDETPKAKKAAPAKNTKVAAKGKKQESSDDSDDEPPKKTAAATKKTKKAESSDDDSEAETKPKGPAAAAKVNADNKSKNVDYNENSYGDNKKAGGAGGAGGEVFVRGLPFTSSEEEIRSHFESCGHIESINLLKGYDGRSKGIAFVRFNTDAEVDAAVGMNETELGGRSIFVEKSTPKEQRNQQGGGSQQGGARPFNQGPKTAQDPSSTTVFIGNLSYQSTEDSIKEHFQDCGEIYSVRVAKDQDGRMRGFGHIDFASADSCKTAVEKAGSFLDGRAINVDFAGGKKGGSGGDRGGFGGGRGGFGGGRGGFGGGRGGGRGGRGGFLSQDDSNAKKGAIGDFQGQKKKF